MCGIFGGTPELISADADRLLLHRGPDQQGQLLVPAPDGRQVLIGQTRLSIVYKKAVPTPMMARGATLAFNGEIYNWPALRRELEAKGYRFQTPTDTEVVLYAYLEWGPACLERFNGMFAIALWHDGQLFLARDRLGKKPLLYAQPDPRSLLFGSEHGALLRSGIVDRAVNPAALDLYLSLGYVPAPHTAFRGIRKLLPGHRAVWQDGQLDCTPYWSLPAHATRAIDEPAALEELDDLLRRAVRSRLISDVPLGAYLSGGVDSSLVVALMAQETGTVRTFTIGFDEQEFSELEHARRVAQRYGTEHHELVVRPRLVEIAPILARHYGDPFADSSAIPTYYLAKMAREQVTVALNGDGGDESFSGYDRYRAMSLARTVGRLVGPVGGALGRVLAGPARSTRDRRQRARRFVEAAGQPEPERYLRWVGIFSDVQKAGLTNESFPRSDPSAVELMRGWMREGDHPSDRANAADLRSYLPDDLLAKVDIASMAASLEVRSPLLDRSVIEFGVSLPRRLRIRQSEGKYLLKRLAERYVPRENLYRQKMGFGLPIGQWLRGDLRDWAHDLLTSPRSERGYFRPGAVANLLDEHVGGGADHTARLWALVMLELWHREVVDAA